jgi:hypothetical protein
MEEVESCLCLEEQSRGRVAFLYSDITARLGIA